MAGAQDTVFTLATQPGIRRDGTTIDGNFYSDGEWVRFQRGRPKKMLGYRRATNLLHDVASKVLVWSRQNLNEVFTFCPDMIQMVLIDNNGVGNSVIDRTPSGYSAASDVIWSADTQYDDAVGSDATVVIAHASSSGMNIDDSTATKPYWALANGSSLFQSITDAPAVSGGVFCIPPYTVAHGSDGFVGWSDSNQPQVWAGSTTPGDAGSDRVTGAKVVKGLPLRSSAGPSAILWSLDSVIKMEWIGGGAIFRFSTLSSQSSILAQNSAIEYDGAYYWIGVDRFMTFDGGVKELPNTMNQNYFFDNLNYAYRQKVWATKVPRFGEIWWFYPRGDATECSHVIIYNVREKTWYDAVLARSAGFYSQTLRFPVMTSNSVEEDTPVDYVAQPWVRETTAATVIRVAHGLTVGQSINVSVTSDSSAITTGTKTVALTYAAQAWTRVTTTATVTHVAHGFIAGDIINVTVTSDAAAITVASKTILAAPTADTFTFACLNAGATSGTLSYTSADRFYFTCLAAGDSTGTLTFDTIDQSYGLYVHEQGTDAVVGDNQTALCSSFTTANFGFPTGGAQESVQGIDNWTRLTRVEPDFIQTGDMQLEVLGYEFAASAADAAGATYTFGPDDGKVDMREQHRYIQLKFTSNAAGGNYEMGKVVVHTELGDLRS